MILRLALFMSMALGVLGLGGVGWLAMHGDPAPAPVIAPLAPPPLPPVLASVLVASKALRAGSLLKPDDIAAQPFAPADMPAHALADTRQGRSDLAGAMLRRQLTPAEPIEPADVLLPGEHGFLAAVLQPGMRAATVAVDIVSGSAGLIWPGDRVDVLLTQAIEDPKLPAGRRLAGEIVLQDLRIIAVDAQLVRGAVGGADQQPAKTVTLEVTPEQAERVAVASRIGRLQITVRAAGDAQVSDNAAKAGTLAAPQPTGRTTWASDVSHALDGAAPSAPGDTVRVFLGTAESKEFHFQ